MFVLNFFILAILILISVAFYVVLERKILGYLQIRKGPFKVGFIGILQPFSDAIKLFSKESFFIYFGNLMIYYFMPFFSLLISLNLWCLYPLTHNFISFPLGVLFFVCCSSFMVYGTLLSGWSSNSIYSLIGSIRSIAQSISYEVCLFLILFVLIILFDSFNLMTFFFIQNLNWFVYMNMFLFLMLMSCVLAETNRSPFDFSEGESELVSGFNVEYSSFNFSFIFLSEYSNMIFMSFLMGLFFLGGNYYEFFFFLSVMILSILFIWIRGSLPRYRYDKLMILCWKIYLPVSLNLFLFTFFLMMIMI
uniref:NADH-ubiquinone oxidoreductase chain 1 n=1 Tax=Epeurysa nawaii TaxID=1308479 RepID=A0A7S4YYQ7_9HEMI|nr:NADH dehydrogenase subunit 1 [Epeurysa nawaii]QBZ38003.1 NADH dehydrogenase subunit 1 [Epeurysa nawaii]QBZ38016.1 NADH dehydrogenase subunit 1 [Epeurysa nawaii]